MGQAKHRVLAALGLWCAAAGGRLTFLRGAEPGFVGSGVCAGCHPAECRTYSESTMSRSFALATGRTLPGGSVRLESASAQFTIDPGGRFEFERRGISGSRRIAFVIGSGEAAYSVL